jgi:hypothetical protein
MSKRSNPIEHVASIWKDGGPDVADIRKFWPELADALDGLVNMQDRMVTEPGAVTVPPLAPPGAIRAPRSRSVGRGGSSGTEPTRAPIIAPQNRPSI